MEIKCCLDCNYLKYTKNNRYYCSYKDLFISYYAIDHRFFCYDCEIAIFSKEESTAGIEDC